MARYPWTILALGTGAQTAYSAVFLGIPVLAPALQKEYDLDLTQVGLAIAAASVGSVFTLLAWGLLADRVGERVVLAAASVRATPTRSSRGASTRCRRRRGSHPGSR